MMTEQATTSSSNRSIRNEEDIIQSFENDTFLNKYRTQDSAQKIFSQLDNIYLWLNRDFLPYFLFKLPTLSEEEVKECRNKSKLIRRVLTTVNRSMKKRTSRSGFAYTCSKCKTTIKNDANHSASVALQQHEHIESALANCHSLQMNSNCSIDKNDGQKSVVLNYCDNCNATLIRPTNFKFNFNISYHPDVERFLYMHNFTNDVVTIDNLNLFTLRLIDGITCVCLLCKSDFGVPLVREHVRGHKHEKNKSDPVKKDYFLAYHTNWLKQDGSCQAHQVHFLPYSVDAAVCGLCNNTYVPYMLLQDHIKDTEHKSAVLDIVDHTVLLGLQKQVYLKNEAVKKTVTIKQEKNIEEPSTSSFKKHEKNIEEPSTSSSNHRVSESEDSDDETTGESDDLSRSEPEEEVEKNTNTTKTVKAHDVIRSIACDSSVSLHNFIEHRFLPHFDKIMHISGKKVDCSFCNLRMDKEHNIIIQHIISNIHRKCREVPRKRYTYYCEVCNNSFNTEPFWMAHFKSDGHKNRCQKLGESRKKKLAEYECTTCKQIIFGDDISVNRHNALPIKGRKRKSTRVVLDQRIVQLFMREENIINEACKLVKDAESVVLNQVNVTECCNAIKEVLMETYPNCNVYPFGSQVSGLGSKRSDLDLFVDLGDMYTGVKGQDSSSQVRIVSNVMKIFAKQKAEFQYLNPIPRARTPIIQMYHVKTRLDCDLSFRHGLSVENTKFLRLCLKAQPCIQPMILLLKMWLDHTKLAHKNITTYSLAMMVIFYLQEINYMLPVHALTQLSSAKEILIDGWSVMDISKISVDEVKSHITHCSMSMKDLLLCFYSYYKNFDYASEIICPLLGRPIKKSLFITNPQGSDLPLEMSIYVHKIARNTTEPFKAQSAMCIQDPFDLSHNLTKGCSNNVVEKYKKLCDLSYKQLGGT